MSGVLVTGGAGFIGSHLVDRLVAEGEQVRILDNLDPLAHPSGEPPAHLNPAAELVRADLRDRAALDHALEGVDRVFHLGGMVGNGESMVNVRNAVEVNSTGTATLLEAVIARRDRIRRVVVASSMVVYGEGAYRCPVHGEVAASGRPLEQLRRRAWEPLCSVEASRTAAPAGAVCGRELEPVPVREDAALRPASVYGITKRDTEELSLVLGQAYGLEVVALRYLNVYGPRQALGNPYTGVAAIFASRLLSGRAPLVFEDGGQIRDLVHVSDVVEATGRAMSVPGAAGHVLNVATGRRVTVLDIVRGVAGALGVELEPELPGQFRVGDIRHCYAATDLAREVLGFEARRTLADGLPELAAWVREQTVDERGDEAVADLRARGLVG